MKKIDLVKKLLEKYPVLNVKEVSRLNKSELHRLVTNRSSSYAIALAIAKFNARKEYSKVKSFREYNNYIIINDKVYNGVCGKDLEVSLCIK